MNSCRVTSDLNAYHAKQDLLARSEPDIAREQLAMIRDVANLFINNGVYMGKKSVPVYEGGGHAYKLVDHPYSFIDVDSRCRDEVPVGYFKLHKDDPTAASTFIDGLIAQKAEEIAFEALDLESNPFVDLFSLKCVLGLE